MAERSLDSETFKKVAIDWFQGDIEQASKLFPLFKVNFCWKINLKKLDTKNNNGSANEIDFGFECN